MAAALIDGKAFAATLRERIAAAVPAFAAVAGRAPGLAVVLVGEDPASQVYVRAKGKAVLAAGMASFEHKLPDATTGAELIALVERLNADDAVDGILVQLPLPAAIDAQAVIAAIDPAKDVDGFTPVNAGRLAVGAPGLVPCTPLGCLMLLGPARRSSGLDAVVVGSNIVYVDGAIAARENCTSSPTAVPRPARARPPRRHSRGRDRAGGNDQGRLAEPGATVIDVGMNRVDGLTGDATPPRRPVAAAITPVPGGVGPMTIALLLRNTLAAAHARAGLGPPEGL